MNIVEKESKIFSSDFFEGQMYNNTLGNLKSKLTTKLYDFSRDRDKLDFLKILRQESLKLEENHKRECNSAGCSKVEEFELGLFVIDQEIDSINSYYCYEPKSNDTFSSEEESDIHSKLNDIIDTLKNLGYGQEIIFEEIESLKEHFNLGKKTWFQLLKGKILDLTIQGLIDKTAYAAIVKIIGDGYKELLSIVE